MKTIKKAIITVLCLLGFAACTDFFESKTPTAISPEDALANTRGMANTIKGIYATLWEPNNLYRNRLACGYQGMNTDIEFNTKTGSAETDACRYNITETNSYLSYPSVTQDPWSVLNDAIDQCNVALLEIGNAAERDNAGAMLNDTVKYFYGELLTLRAFIYLELVKFWGDVPARFMPIVTDDDVYTPKSDRNVIYEQLRIDLKQAAEMMPWSDEIPWFQSNNKVTAINKAFALGLLARANLMYAGYSLRPDVWTGAPGATHSIQFNVKNAGKRAELYQEALDACGQIIVRYGNSKLSASFEKVFRDICADNTSFSDTEWIWVLEFSNGARGQFINYNGIKSKDAVNVLKNQKTSTGNNVQAIVPTFVYDFEANDTRKWVTVAPFTWAADDASGMASDPEKREIYFHGCPAAERRLYQKNVDITGMYLGKYRTEWMVRPFTGGDDGVDYPVMRYADILLMYAEASIGGISGDVPANNSYSGAGSGQEAFDNVRKRAYDVPVVPVKELTMDNIIDERAFEFCGEYIRKYDLMRWGKLKEKLVKTKNRIADLSGSVVGGTVVRGTEFEGLVNDTIYIKYKQNNEYLDAGSTVKKAYVFDGEVYGLAKGQTGTPFSNDDDNLWVRKNPYQDSKTLTRYLSNYYLYDNEDKIDIRHYWPIFQLNISGSRGTLWNDLW